MSEFIADNNPSEKDIGFIELKLREYNRRFTGLEPVKDRAVYIKEDGDIKGGVVYICMKPWAFVKLLWVSEEKRGCGIGSKILRAAESDAREQGSTKIMLDTFSFQAPEFYKKQGYSIISKIENYPIDGTVRYWLTKQL